MPVYPVTLHCYVTPTEDSVHVYSDGGLSVIVENNQFVPWFGPLDWAFAEEAELAALEAQALDNGTDPELAW